MRYKKKKDGVFYCPQDGRMWEHRGYSRKLYWNKQMIDYLKRHFATTLNDDLAEFIGVSKSSMIRKARELRLKKDPEWLRKVFKERANWAHIAHKRKGYPGRFPKGHRSPTSEFKPGHRQTPEQKEKSKAKMRLWYRMNPRAASEKARKAWETRRKNQQKTTDYGREQEQPATA